MTPFAFIYFSFCFFRLKPRLEPHDVEQHTAGVKMIRNRRRGAVRRMTRFTSKLVYRFALLLVVLLSPCCISPLCADDLEQAFGSPPADARPWVYWYFSEGMMTREGMTADLEAMKRVGIGGAIILEADLGLPDGPVRFLSREWLELMRHALHEADRLGVEIALATGPGWCGTGGPWVTPEHSMQHLVASQTDLVGPLRISILLPQPAPRTPYFGIKSLDAKTKAQWEGYYRDVAVLAFPSPQGTNRLADVDEKALFFREPYSSIPDVKPFLPAPTEARPLPAGQCVPSGQVLDLSAKVSRDGRLKWDAPAGRWTVLRLGRTTTGQTGRPAPKLGLGLECDKLDAAALDEHFHAFCGKLISLAGPATHPGAGLTTLHFDSWEMSSQNWTANFPREFKQRRGYELWDYLPAYSGFVMDSAEISERFLWDVRQTASDLVVENHARHLRELAHRHGLKLAIEPYALNPAGDLALGAEADVPMGEFWADGDQYNTAFSCLEASSIGHTHGKPVVAAEAFTSGSKEVFTRHPGNLKNQADWALALGINRLVIHRYQHQPWTNRVPGMTMSEFGIQYERTETWWEMSGPWHTYLARCQHLLRQGLPVADILYLTPEGAPHVFLPPASALAGTTNMPDRKGYTFDGIDARTLVERVRVKGGRLVLPDGMSYRLLVLPETRAMTPALLAKVEELATAGATILGSLPVRSPSLAGYPQCDAEVKRLADALRKHVSPVDYTNGLYAPPYCDYETVACKLAALHVPPDFEGGNFRFNHRHLSDSDLFFVSNPSNATEEVTCLFRVFRRQPELWDPLTGQRRGLADFAFTPDGRTRVPLRLEAGQSLFLVFRQPVAAAPSGPRPANFADLQPAGEATGPWEILFQAQRGAPARITLGSLISWTDHTDPGVKYFSGEAVYHKTLAVPGDLAGAKPLYLDLGRVEVMAEVTLNGRRFDPLWCAPYRQDISSAVRAGENRLEVRVVNLWPNRMIGDEQLPPDTIRRRKGNTGNAYEWPDWLLAGKSSPVGRITWAANHWFTNGSPLLPSGLLGPVRFLRSAGPTAP
jgi:hypothetical protein